jgi:isopenicillin N synthase-like dioxygenase
LSILSAKSLPATALPVIDVSGLRSPLLADRQTIAAQMRAACLDTGFFYITGHGVPSELRRRLFAEAKRFFALPMDVKTTIDKRQNKFNRGYEALRGQTLEAGAPPDLKEGFQVGGELALEDPQVLAGKWGAGPNLWPSDLPGFRETVQAYYDVVLELEHMMWRGLALSLGLAEDHFADFVKDAYANMRLLHYPPQPPNPLPNEKGCGAHTDFGGMTMLLQDDVGGLQVWDKRTDEWIYAPPIPDTYLVNLGDMVARWTNDRYRSTVHRVVNMSGRERYSVAFFFSGNPDYVVSCLPTCLAAGETAKYPPLNVAQHMTEMFRRTYK